MPDDSSRLMFTDTPGYCFLNSAKTSGRTCRQVPSLAPTTISPRGHALHFRHGGDHGAAGLDGVFGVFLKDLAGGGERDLASGAVEQPGADFVLQGADLGGDRRLRAKALLRGAREAAEARDFEERLQLVEIHKKSS